MKYKLLFTWLCFSCTTYAITSVPLDNINNTNQDNLKKERKEIVNKIAHDSLDVTLKVLRQQEEEAKKDIVIANRNIQKDLVELNKETARLKALIAQVGDKPPNALQGSKKLKQNLAVGCILQVDIAGKTETVNVCK